VSDKTPDEVEREAREALVRFEGGDPLSVDSIRGEAFADAMTALADSHARLLTERSAAEEDQRSVLRMFLNGFGAPSRMVTALDASGRGWDAALAAAKAVDAEMAEAFLHELTDD